MEMDGDASKQSKLRKYSIDRIFSLYEGEQLSNSSWRQIMLYEIIPCLYEYCYVWCEREVFRNKANTYELRAGHKQLKMTRIYFKGLKMTKKDVRC